MRPEEFRADKKRPFTGAEFLESVRHGREVYFDGERVKDLTTHPAFRNSVRSIARLYDALHDPKMKDVLTTSTDAGGGYTHKYFKVAHSREEMVAQKAAIATWSRMTYGWMGRTPDYKAALMNTLGANAEYYGKFADNARAWYTRAQEPVLFMNHAIVNPPVDRSKSADQVKDVYVSIKKETDAGIYVSGAKVVATSAAFTHYNFLGQNPAGAGDDSDLAVMFIMPMDAPGVKLFCRNSYENIAASVGTPFDYPLSSRFDENDAIFVLDNVFIPWEDVLVHRDPDRIKSFYPTVGLPAGLLLPGLHPFCSKARLHGRTGRARAALHRRGHVPRQPGDARRNLCVAESVLVACGRHGQRSAAVGRRRGAAEARRGARVSRFRGRRLCARSRRSWRRSSPRRSSISRHRRVTSRIRKSIPISRVSCAGRTASTTRSASKR